MERVPVNQPCAPRWLVILLLAPWAGAGCTDGTLGSTGSNRAQGPGQPAPPAQPGGAGAPSVPGPGSHGGPPAGGNPAPADPGPGAGTAPATPPPPAPGTPTPPPVTPPSTGQDPPGTPPPPPVAPPAGTPPAPTPTPTPPPAPPPATPSVRLSELEMPTGVYQLLERRCSSCHTYGERDPAGWGSVLDLSRMIAADIVVPGDPDRSRLIQRVAVRADMPLNGARLSGPEVQVLRAWIANLQRPVQRPRSHEQLLDLIAADQNLAAVRNQGTDHRYLSFAHLADDRRAPEEMRAAEAVLAVVLNSLSRRATLVKPEPIDPLRTIFRFRLSALGWSRDDWDRVASFYPYCYRSDRAPHRAVYTRLQTEAPLVRGDWFLATATVSPLYEELLDLPATLAELEDDLGIDITAAINHLGQDRPRDLLRIGFRSSGVSAHNRMLERHKQRNGGFFWLSYDFDADDGRQDLRANPLGPRAIDQRNFQRTFEHAGGEVIFSLPNGLQAYLLVNAAGNRISLAPKEIVRDPRRRAGAVQNGVSCFGCHGISGMNYPRVYDEIPAYADEHRDRFSGAELQEIRALYPKNGAQVLAADALVYQKAKESVGGGRWQPGVIEWDDFINLVGQYEAEVGLRGAALELGVDVAAARAAVERGRNEDALPLGLGDPLVTRDDFVCRLRRIAPDLRRIQFCQGTFQDAQVRAVCE
jgi:hypothetical protein